MRTLAILFDCGKKSELKTWKTYAGNSLSELTECRRVFIPWRIIYSQNGVIEPCVEATEPLQMLQMHLSKYEHFLVHIIMKQPTNERAGYPRNHPSRSATIEAQCNDVDLSEEAIFCRQLSVSLQSALRHSIWIFLHLFVCFWFIAPKVSGFPLGALRPRAAHIIWHSRACLGFICIIISVQFGCHDLDNTFLVSEIWLQSYLFCRRRGHWESRSDITEAFYN